MADGYRPTHPQLIEEVAALHAELAPPLLSDCGVRRVRSRLARDVLEGIPEAISVLAGGRRIFANQAFADLFGYRDVGEALAAPAVADVLPEDSP